MLYVNMVLKVVSLPKSVTTIGTSIFRACYCIEYLTLPPSITEITSDLVRGCGSLKELIMPAGITNIASNSLNGCYLIKILDFSNASAVPTLANTNAFTGLNKLCKIIVPDSLYTTWIAANYWSNYANQIIKVSEA